MNEISTSVAESRQKTELVNPENFVTIQGWMVTDLHLKGASLLIYAIIYGFSQDNSSVFSGTASYLAEWVSVSTNRVYEILKELCEKRIIEKVEKKVNGVTLYDYRASKVGTLPTKLATPTNKVGYPPTNKVGNDNINIYNIKDNINIISKPKTVARKRNALQVFSNAVIEGFEPEVKTDSQKEIWFRRNCRNLKDILSYCNQDIELGLFTINETCTWLANNKLQGGYEAVCRNLPEMYSKALKCRQTGTKWQFSEDLKKQLEELGEKK